MNAGNIVAYAQSGRMGLDRSQVPEALESQAPYNMGFILHALFPLLLTWRRGIEFPIRLLMCITYKVNYYLELLPAALYIPNTRVSAAVARVHSKIVVASFPLTVPVQVRSTYVNYP